LALGACGTSAEPETPPATSNGAGGETAAAGACKADLGQISTKDDKVYYSVGPDEWAGYNGITPENYSTYNSAVNDRMFGGFMYFGTDGSICQDKEYGSFKLVSESPMKVEYTLNDAATWSDGTPIAYEDYVLDWAAQTISDGEDEEGNPKPLFNHVAGLDFGERVPAGPEGEVGGKTFTYTYKDPYPDYQLQVTSALPAHIVAKQAGMSVDELVKALKDKDVAKLKPAAEFWNEGWLSKKPGELPDPAITPVSGPYKLGSWAAGQSITLVPNDKYWGTPPATKELIYRFTAPEGMVQALANGDLNVIEPQATVDTIEQIKGLGDDVKMETGQSLTWEHLDFNFKGTKFGTSKELREAFAMCVPRQLIVDNLIKPINPDAVVMNAREVFPFQDNYQDVVDAAYDGRYDEVNLEGAKKKLAEAGETGKVKVRIGYNAPNQRRTDEVALIKSSCDQAGFDIQDVGNPKFFTDTLPKGAYDVALFAWAGSGQIVSGQNIYSTKGGQNYGSYSSKAVDEAWDALGKTLDTAKQQEQVKIIEKALWDDLFGIPVFAHPNVAAFDSKLSNVRSSAAQSGIMWNAEQWVRTS
jgi:peptide/nickel transport system substrate-binding protein